MKYVLLGVEGPHDQAFVGRVLRKLLGFKEFRGNKSELDKFWHPFIPKYPSSTGNLYQRLPMPSILETDIMSVAIYQGTGSNLAQNLDDILANNLSYQNSLSAFGIIVDADRDELSKICTDYQSSFKNYFPNFPNQGGLVDRTSPRTGIYILPDNQSHGVLDTVLCRCADVVYSEYIRRARSYIERFSEEEIRAKPIKWKPHDREKALVATVVSILKPGKTNTASLSDNDWVSEQTRQQVSELKQFVDFLQQLLNLQP